MAKRLPVFSNAAERGLAGLRGRRGPASARARRLRQNALCVALGAALVGLAPLAGAQQAAAPGSAVTGGDVPGSFKLPGSDTSVRIYGYVKLDAVYSDKSAGVNNAADLLPTPQAIPVGPNAGANEKDQLKLGARESRLGVGTSTPTQWGPLVTLLEGDFYGADGNETVSNSHGFRLRHAYGIIGSFGAGQRNKEATVQTRPWLSTGLLLAPAFAPFANATALYPEDTAALREAWVRATSRVGQTDRARGEPGAPRLQYRTDGIEQRLLR